MSSVRDAEFTEYAHARLSWLRGVAYMLCQDWHRADDLVQVTLARLYTHWDAARSADSLDGYARTVLVREYLRERSSWWGRKVVLTAEPPDSIAAAPGPASAELGLRDGLAVLPRGQRAVMVLRFYCDLSVDQAAQVLGCSPGTVKSQTAKAVRALRRWLDISDLDLPGTRERPPTLEGSEHG